MAWSMSSEEIQLLAAGYVLGDLDPNEVAVFEQLLRDDPAIAAEVAKLQTALELSFEVEEVTPPAHLRSAILNASQPAVVVSSRPGRSARRRMSWNTALGATAAALILGLGISNYRLWQALRTSDPATQQAEAIVYSLQATEPTNRASATVVVNPNRLEAQLRAENLPPLPPDKVYVLWTVLQQGAPFTVDSKNAILTEVFEVDAQGNVSQTVTLPPVYRAGAVARVAITVEDAAAPQAHEGSPVLITDL
jgi:anti-sigma-K factor RskA